MRYTAEQNFVFKFFFSGIIIANFYHLSVWYSFALFFDFTPGIFVQFLMLPYSLIKSWDIKKIEI